MRELLALGEGDREFLGLIKAECESLWTKVEEMSEELSRTPQDRMSCYAMVKAGSGGDEACLWTAMLLRMYLLYAKRKGLGTELLDIQHNKPCGIKSATFRVHGHGAYGLLRPEEGIHRLSRISPLGHSERHTSRASVSVFPEVAEQDLPELNDADIQVSFCCGSGPGGQHKNKRATTVRIKHGPTGISVRCETERSQSQNRRIALRMLASKLAEVEKERMRQEAEEERKAKPGIGFGNRDRTYVFVPYQLVHDHNTGRKTLEVQRVLDGDIDILRG